MRITFHRNVLRTEANSSKDAETTPHRHPWHLTMTIEADHLQAHPDMTHIGKFVYTNIVCFVHSVVYSRRRSMSPPRRSASGPSYYDAPPPAAPPGGRYGSSYRAPSDYPPSNGYYDVPPSASSGYRGPPPRDDRDTRYAESRAGPPGGYDRR